MPRHEHKGIEDIDCPSTAARCRHVVAQDHPQIIEGPAHLIDRIGSLDKCAGTSVRRQKLQGVVDYSTDFVSGGNVIAGLGGNG